MKYSILINLILVISIINISVYSQETDQQEINKCGDNPLLPHLQNFLKQYKSDTDNDGYIDNILKQQFYENEPQLQEDLSYCSQFNGQSSCCAEVFLEKYENFLRNYFNTKIESEQQSQYGHIITQLEGAIHNCQGQDENISSIDFVQKLAKNYIKYTGKLLQYQLRYLRGNVCGLCVDPQNLDDFFNENNQLKLNQESYQKYEDSLNHILALIRLDQAKLLKWLRDPENTTFQIVNGNKSCQQIKNIVLQVLDKKVIKNVQCQQNDVFGDQCLETLFEDLNQEYNISDIYYDGEDVIDGEYNNDEDDGESQQEQEQSEQKSSQQEQEQDESEQQSSQEEQEDGESSEYFSELENDGEDGELNLEDIEEEEEDNNPLRNLLENIEEDQFILVKEGGLLTYLQNLEAEINLKINGVKLSEFVPQVEKDIETIKEQQQNEQQQQQNDNQDKNNNQDKGGMSMVGVAIIVVAVLGILGFGLHHYMKIQNEQKMSFAIKDFEEQYRFEYNYQQDQKQTSIKNKKSNKKSSNNEDSLELTLLGEEELRPASFTKKSKKRKNKQQYGEAIELN